MTGSTKILTVSYGTFSCTLEGFDDPFGTMRGIAEYFRDLAADDRYFGAEPPTPDVEMLQRIAEQEVQRRVEARMGDAGVALTQVTEVIEEESPEVAAETVGAPVDAADEAVVEPAPEVVAEPEPETKQPFAEPHADVAEDVLETGPLALDDDYLLSDEPEDVLAVDPDARPPQEGPAETVAEKLRRIRAVVSKSIEPKQEDDTSFSESQAQFAAESEEPPKRERALSETIRQITADLAEDDDVELAGEDHRVEDLDLSTEIEDDEWPADDDYAEVEEQSIFADDGDAEDAAFEEPLNDTATEEDVIAAVASAMSDDQYEEAADEDYIEGAGEDVADDVAEERAADHSEEEPHLESAEVGEADEAAEVTPGAPEQDEADTSNVLTLDSGDEVKERDAAPSSRRTPMSPIHDNGSDVGRLMAETDSKLLHDESVRRRRVISQMRAAVAATKADRALTGEVTSREQKDAVEQEPYRDDLQEAVGRGSRSGGERPISVAPLVLVSSQRVDETRVYPKEKIVPKENIIPESAADVPQDFAGFAKAMGAEGLPEVMEAAAAFSMYVEGQEAFSRPEIMKRVSRYDPALTKSREDGLRSFGQLLRQGKLRKLERGLFTVADSTRFKPEDGAAHM